jgi:hypothetical protein
MAWASGLAVCYLAVGSLGAEAWVLVECCLVVEVLAVLGEQAIRLWTVSLVPLILHTISAGFQPRSHQQTRPLCRS